MILLSKVNSTVDVDVLAAFVLDLPIWVMMEMLQFVLNVA